MEDLTSAQPHSPKASFLLPPDHSGVFNLGLIMGVRGTKGSQGDVSGLQEPGSE